MIKAILRGMVIGIANIIPGVSGGTMAVAMGIYDKIIHAATHLFSEFKKSMKVLLPILIGAALAVVLVARVIEFAFEKAPIQTNLLFIGLILGSLPMMAQKVKKKKPQLSHILSFAIFFVVVILFALLGEEEERAAHLSVDLIGYLKLFGVGVVAAATMVIPGVSGSMMLMLMGYYNPVLKTINSFISHLTQADFAGMWADCGILIPFGLGVVVGIVAIAKIIEKIFEKFPLQAYWAIIGLIIASPVAIVLLNDFSGINFMTIATGIVMLIAGILISRKLGGE
ncbi:MAG: DUF368 domain-containing protein [Lachnospiraceae bacterium]|nr:DUF368 domain-containing protein [Lachnospiraceae bacterium]